MINMELLKETYIEGLIFNGITIVIVSSIFIKYNFEEKKRERQANTTRKRRKGARAQQANKYNIVVSELETKAVKGQQLGKYNLIVADIEPWTKEDIKTYNQIAQ